MSACFVQAEELLRTALRRMVDKYPFNAGLLSFDQFCPDPAVGTMAAMVKDGRVRYAYAPDFVCQCMPPELMGVLHHEVNHVLFGHVFADRKEYPDRWARTVAEEVTVNEWIREPLPGSPLTLEQFPDLPPSEDTYTRYQRLVGRKDRPRRLRTLDNHSLWRKESPPDVQLGGLSSVREMLERLAAQPKDESTEILMRELHHSWRIPLGDARIEAIGQTDSAREPLNWDRLLRRYLDPSPTRRFSFHRPSRRFPELVGVIPGHVQERARARVMAVIDTSGSITRPILERINKELRQIGKKGKVTVVECDKRIHAAYPYRSDITEVRGRGGTDLRPPFEHAFLAKHRPRVIVYFTDGGGRAPLEPPSVPVVWCLSPRGVQPARWGRSVKMPV